MRVPHMVRLFLFDECQCHLKKYLFRFRYHWLVMGRYILRWYLLDTANNVLQNCNPVGHNSLLVGAIELFELSVSWVTWTSPDRIYRERNKYVFNLVLVRSLLMKYILCCGGMLILGHLFWLWFHPDFIHDHHCDPDHFYVQLNFLVEGITARDNTSRSSVALSDSLWIQVSSTAHANCFCPYSLTWCFVGNGRQVNGIDTFREDPCIKIACSKPRRGQSRIRYLIRN